MNFRNLVLCAAAGLTGWWSVAWMEGTLVARPPAAASPPVADVRQPDPAVSAAAALQAVSRPVPGSAELRRIATLAVSILDDDVAAAQTLIEKWPPGAARAFALAVLKERSPEYDPDFDPFNPAPEAAEPPFNRFRQLEEFMADGYIMSGASLTTGGLWGDYITLNEWVATDPAAATSAILKMPPGSCRNNAVGNATGALAASDPAVALEFAIESGEQHLGSGVADAWAKLAFQDAAPHGNLETLQSLTGRMTPVQQEGLFAALAELVRRGDFDDTNAVAGGDEPVRDSDLARLAFAVVKAGEPGPGFESFFRELTRYPATADEVRISLQGAATPYPARKTAVEILMADKMNSLVDDTDLLASGFDAGKLISNGYFERISQGTDHAAVLEYAAPALLPQLARSGHLAEALQTLDRIRDPDARRASLESVLPYWMDADPAAARAAFDAAPLTALERERWQSHPAFLLHPQ